MTRDYILSRQPWGFDSLPLQYIPMNQLRWFPPIFYLGVPLTFGEARQLVTHLGLVLEGEDAHYVHYSVARRLSQLCGFTVPDSSYPLHRVTVKVCDTQGQPQMLAMVSNYQIPEDLDYEEPHAAMVNILKGAFGESKKAGWWLEYSRNHSPKHEMVRETAHARSTCEGGDWNIPSGTTSNRSGSTAETKRTRMRTKQQLRGFTWLEYSTGRVRDERKRRIAR